MRLGVMQPYFLPYLGYLQLMTAVDKFVVYDDVQYIVGGWVNRNRIKGQDKDWTYLNVQLRGASPSKAILEVSVESNSKWRRKALGTLRSTYGNSTFFPAVYPLAERIINFPSTNLADFLTYSLRVLADVLDIKTEIIPSSRHYGNEKLDRSSRLLDICEREGCSTYINAIGGRELYTKESFAAAGIDLYFLQPDLRWPSEIPCPNGSEPEGMDLSILHLLFTYGPDICRKLVRRGNLV